MVFAICSMPPSRWAICTLASCSCFWCASFSLACANSSSVVTSFSIPKYSSIETPSAAQIKPILYTLGSFDDAEKKLLMVDAEMSVMSDKSCIVKFCRSFASLHKSCNVFTIFPFYSFFGQENSNSGLPQTVIIRIWYCPAKP